MMQSFINRVGSWNPQLFRELKGRLKTRNILLVTALSLLGQFVLFMSFQTQLPNNIQKFTTLGNRYCTGKVSYDLPDCLSDGFGGFIINWQLWSFDIFFWLSTIASFGLLVTGAYLLIHDLATEEQRDTLNFIRLSPQSPQSILWGKMLGVPVLLYVALLTALPLHLWSGLNAQIPLRLILSFYAVVIAAGLLYFSGALLFGLVGSWLGGFQAWLGSGALLGYLMFTKQAIAPSFTADAPIVILGLLNPYYLIPHQAINSQLLKNLPEFNKFHWFTVPIGKSFGFTIIFALLLYLIGAYFIWQSLQRCFREPNSTILSKKQSYLLTACFTVITIGSANLQTLAFGKPYVGYVLRDNLVMLMFLNLWLFLYLIAALSPHRQTLQDWARYRHAAYIKDSTRSTLIQDLIWGEKSPGILAIAINAMIAIICLSFLVLVSQVQIEDKFNGLISLAFAGTLTAIYAALTQLVLFLKTPYRVLWASGVLVSVIILPPIILAVFFSEPKNHTFLWLFSVVAPLVSIYPNGIDTRSITSFLAILGHFAILGLFISQLTQKLRKSGESATKALLAGN